jgi:CBS domain-containing protein
MNIRELSIKRDAIKYVTEANTLQDALDIMQDNNFRSLPILSQSGTMYRGNVYRQHIYKRIVNGESLDVSVTHHLKNATKYIYTNSTLFQTIFAIRDLPYISVLNEDHTFYGILTHRAFERGLFQAWSLDEEGFVLTIQARQDDQGAIAVISRIIGRFTSINTVVTSVDPRTNVSNIIISLNGDCSPASLEKIVTRIERKNYKVLSVNNTKSIALS